MTNSNAMVNPGGIAKERRIENILIELGLDSAPEKVPCRKRSTCPHRCDGYGVIKVQYGVNKGFRGRICKDYEA